MEKLKFIVERNPNGCWARREESGAVIGAYGETLTELKADVVNAYNLLHNDEKIVEELVVFQFDIPPAAGSIVSLQPKQL